MPLLVNTRARSGGVCFATQPSSFSSGLNTRSSLSPKRDCGSKGVIKLLEQKQQQTQKRRMATQRLNNVPFLFIHSFIHSPILLLPLAASTANTGRRRTSTSSGCRSSKTAAWRCSPSRRAPPNTGSPAPCLCSPAMATNFFLIYLSPSGFLGFARTHRLVVELLVGAQSGAG